MEKRKDTKDDIKALQLVYFDVMVQEKKKKKKKKGKKKEKTDGEKE